MISCPICHRSVDNSIQPEYAKIIKCTFYEHSCSKHNLYPNFWGYFSGTMPVELLFNLKEVEYYYEAPYGWSIHTGHHDNIVTIAEGEGCYSLQDAYDMLKRYEKLLAFL